MPRPAYNLPTQFKPESPRCGGTQRENARRLEGPVLESTPARAWLPPPHRGGGLQPALASTDSQTPTDPEEAEEDAPAVQLALCFPTSWLRQRF